MNRFDAFEHFMTAIAIDLDIICLQEQECVHCNWGVPSNQCLHRLKKSLRNNAARMTIPPSAARLEFFEAGFIRDAIPTR